MKIGLLGGSFDPVHLAHVALALCALQELKLNEVQLIPAADPWQREPLAAGAQHRVAMLELAVREQPHLRVNPIEINRGGKTYTFDTLCQLPTGPDYYWILGADQLANFCTWHHWQEITDLARLAVALRPGTTLTVPPPLGDHLARQNRPLITLPFQPTPISSTQIRKRLAAGQPTDRLLSVAVAQYIQQNGLYQPPVA
ncbi:nicotinate (nicotinamide) nucleotide adenylyltransferase [Pusillimonas sp. ANT_WB101]|uniref:nicotinate (nicotinamide) nucleotide adenylyltransferase n=1 Tax=Pusillimonas sp. ANT_WB101 TaxID=2597356 RepID=UPI0011F090CA|nr:nicotinate (nicotinamide) nucleotide adenylyltransferase [Pusillimonas sp. ANT_WB101]KAA0911888.1 nicotinate (nicotinamide) nucleotide adenylyltransferase [Pusillimonas sp. ANT_WB101]